MALINCPECGREVSDIAATCPGCGCPITEKDNTIVPDTIDNDVSMPEKQPLYKKRWAQAVALCVVLAVIAGCVVAYQMKKAADEEQAFIEAQVEMPDIVGLSPEEAQILIREASENWVIHFTTDDGTALDSDLAPYRSYQVVSTDPTAGKTLDNRDTSQEITVAIQKPEAVSAVEAMIAAIGEVTLDSQSSVDTALLAFYELPENLRHLVGNSGTLSNAIDEYRVLFLDDLLELLTQRLGGSAWLSAEYSVNGDEVVVNMYAGSASYGPSDDASIREHRRQFSTNADHVAQMLWATATLNVHYGADNTLFYSAVERFEGGFRPTEILSSESSALSSGDVFVFESLTNAEGETKGVEGLSGQDAAGQFFSIAYHSSGEARIYYVGHPFTGVYTIDVDTVTISGIAAHETDLPQDAARPPDSIVGTIDGDTITFVIGGDTIVLRKE